MATIAVEPAPQALRVELTADDLDSLRLIASMPHGVYRLSGDGLMGVKRLVLAGAVTAFQATIRGAGAYEVRMTRAGSQLIKASNKNENEEETR